MDIILPTNFFDILVVKMIFQMVCWLAVFAFISIDLYFGIQKARQLGELRTSEGYKRTIVKFKDYYASLIFAFIFDALLHITFLYEFLPNSLSVVPFVTICITIMQGYTEYKSVKEKGDEKLRRKNKESLTELTDILGSMTSNENLKEVLKVLNEKKEKENEKSSSSIS